MLICWSTLRRLVIYYVSLPILRPSLSSFTGEGKLKAVVFLPLGALRLAAFGVFVGFLLLSMLNQLLRRLFPCGLLKRFDTDEERRSMVTLRAQNALKTLRTWRWTSVLLWTNFWTGGAWCALPGAML